MVKVFVPGGNGFLGKSVIGKLSKRGIDHVSLSLRNDVDFRNFNQVKKIFDEEKFDYVINCAAFVGGIQFGFERPAEIYYNNTLMATYLMEAASKNGVKRFINPISNCSYPSHLTRDFEENQWWDGPLHESVLVYGFIRKASWVQAWAYYNQYGFQTISLILPNMYGPNDHFEEKRSHALGALVMKLVEAKRNNLPTITVWGSGTPIREWLYVEDGAEALIRAIDIEPTIDPINVGVGKGISILELAKLIKDIVGYNGEIILDPSRPDGALYKTMNNNRMKNIFNWTPTTSLKTGIEATVDWYIKNRGGKK